MKAWLKAILIALAVLLALSAAFIAFVHIAWNGGFNELHPKELSTYESPDGKYTLVFEQLGDPVWSFGPANVRLTLKNGSGKTIDQISAEVYEDGASASPANIKDIRWEEQEVVVTLQSSEHPDQILVLSFS